MTAARRMHFSRLDWAAFLTFFTYAAGSVVVPVALVSLSRELGFPLDQGGMAAGGALHLGRTLPMVAAMLGCGFAAGRWGMRPVFARAVLLMGIGIGLCAVAPHYALLFAALAVAGVGEGVIEGLATPFVQELHREEPGRYINFAHAFWPIGVLATVLLSGGLLAAGVSWRLVIGGVAALALVPLALLTLRPPAAGVRAGLTSSPALPWQTVWGQAVAILRRGRFWLFFAAMFVAGGGEFCLTFWSASYIQLQFSASAWAGGAGTASFAAGMMLGRTGWGYLLRQHHLRSLVVYSALAGTAVTAMLPLLADLRAFVALLFLAGLATAPFWPSVQSYCADRLPEADTTMLFVLLSCAGVPGCGFFTWLMGYIGNRAGLGPAFFLVPLCFVCLAGLIGWDWAQARLAERAVRCPPAAGQEEARA